MSQNKFCPACMSYMLQMTNDLRMNKWVKCPTCGWCEDENGQNELTKKWDKENLHPEHRKHLMKNWRKNAKP